MSELRNRDLRRVLDLVGELHAAEEGMVLETAMAGMSGLIGVDTASYSIVEVGDRRLIHSGGYPEGIGPDELAGFAELVVQHPGFSGHARGDLDVGDAAVMSDLADPGELRRLPLYVDFYRPRGVRDQLLGVVSRTAGEGLVLTVNRSRIGFSPRERALMELTLPHVRQAIEARRRHARLTRAVRELRRTAERTDAALLRLHLLTAREREVADHLAAGASDRQIARALGVSPRTVHKHLEHIYGKLGVPGRAALLGARFPDPPRRRTGARAGSGATVAGEGGVGEGEAARGMGADRTVLMPAR